MLGDRLLLKLFSITGQFLMRHCRASGQLDTPHSFRRVCFLFNLVALGESLKDFWKSCEGISIRHSLNVCLGTKSHQEILYRDELSSE